MAEKQYIEVRNLSSDTVVYTIPENNIRRVFRKNETKKIDEEELRNVFYQPGGEVLLRDFLSVRDRNLALEFGVSQDSYDHEYSWTEKDIDNLLQNESIDMLHDALDFAPLGIVESIVARAVKLQVSDVNKRNLIQQVTGKNVDRMIAIQTQLDEELGSDSEDTRPKQRRVNSQNTGATTSQRRVQ